MTLPQKFGKLESHFDKGTTSGPIATMTRRPFSGTRKAIIKLEESRALKLLKATHIKIGWVFLQGS